MIRTLKHCGVLAALFASAGSVALAQTTVQLPTLRSFGVQTTVSVPDGGMAHLGGVTTARAGSSSLGIPIVGGLPGIGRPFNNRGFGSHMTSNQLFVRAQIIDLREMDEAILNDARRRRGPQRLMDPQAAFLAEHMGRSRTAPPAPERAQTPKTSLPIVSSNDETQRLLELGDAALEAGNYELATQYFAAAEKRSSRHGRSRR